MNDRGLHNIVYQSLSLALALKIVIHHHFRNDSSPVSPIECQTSLWSKNKVAMGLCLWDGSAMYGYFQGKHVETKVWNVDFGYPKSWTQPDFHGTRALICDVKIHWIIMVDRPKFNRQLVCLKSDVYTYIYIHYICISCLCV